MIQRNIEHTIQSSLSKKEITIIVGARQVGKTTLLKLIIDQLTKENKKTLFLNFDIEKDAQYLKSQEKLMTKASLEFGNEKGYLFIDEIQQKENAGKFLKGIYDSDFPGKLIVTGSGSLQLKEKVSESLLGRKHLIRMNPITFTEFVNYKTNYKYSDRLEDFFNVEIALGYKILIEYLTFGGYPRLVTENKLEQKLEIISEIFNTYVSRDIALLLQIRTPEKFIRFIQILSTRIGEIINYTSLASDSQITTDTLKQYLWYAEQTFVIEQVKPFYTNPSKEIVKSPVYYYADLGMLNYALNRYGNFVKEQSGFLFQNFIYLLLKEKFYNGLDNIRFWRTKEKAEVDFIVKYTDEIIPFEVKFTNLKKERISRSFRSFIEKYQPANAYIVNIDYTAEMKLNNTHIHFIPYWKIQFL